MPTVRGLLVAIPFSHYCERARWALDIAGVPYRELRVMPLLHMPVVLAVRWWHGVGKRPDRVSSPASTPALVLFDGEGGAARTVLGDSGDIVAWASRTSPAAAARLCPAGTDAARVAEVERLCHDQLGPAARVAAYRYLLPSLPSMRQLAWRNVGVAQAVLWAVLSPLLAWLLGVALRVDAPRGDRAEAKLDALFADLSARLQASPFLGGTEFSAADLTFAALAYPVLGLGQSDGLAAWVPAPADVAPGYAALSERLRATPAGAHALRMFREHRGARAAR